MPGGGYRGRVSVAPLLAASLSVVTVGDVAAADEELFFASLPVVATVSRLPQPLADAPGSVTVIDRELIRSSGARSISDLLRLVPGFQVTPMNTDAPRVIYHGLSDEEYSPRVQVLIDGRSQYSPLFSGGVNWNTLPVAMEDIDRIEVVRGSNSAAYGSNAFLGVVNIITQDASQAKGVTLAASHGNQGVRDELVRVGGKVGVADLRLTVKQQFDEGYRFVPAKASDPQDIADNFRQRLFDVRADVPLGERDELQLSMGQLKNRLDTGRSDEVLNQPRKFSQEHTYFQANWRHNLAPGEEVGVRYSRAEERVVDAYRAAISVGPVTLPFSLDQGGSSTRDDFEFQHTLPVQEQGRLVWGIGHRVDSVESRHLYYQVRKEVRRTSRLFGNLEWRLAPKLVANLGATWEDDAIGGATLAPRLNLNLHPLDGHTVRFGVSRAYRSPTTFEARGDQRIVPDSTPFFARTFLAAPGVKPERIDSIEVGYLGEWKDLGASLDVRLFQERIPNRILVVDRNLQPPVCENLPPPLGPGGCGNADYSVNGERVEITGIEYQAKWQPFEATRLLMNQAFVHIDEHLLSFATATTNWRPYQTATTQSSPSHSTTMMLSQKLPGGLEFSAIQHWVGAMKWTKNTAVEPYRRLDLRVAYPFRLGSTRGEVAFVSQSANGDHAEYKSSRLISERHWLTVRFDL